VIKFTSKIVVLSILTIFYEVDFIWVVPRCEVASKHCDWLIYPLSCFLIGLERKPFESHGTMSGQHDARAFEIRQTIRSSQSLIYFCKFTYIYLYIFHYIFNTISLSERPPVDILLV
jgi:hypothetical protein